MKLFIKNKAILINLIISLGLNILLWLFFCLKMPRLESIPLHYNIYFGIDLIGPWYKIFLLPAGGLIIGLINFLLSYIIYKRERLISYFLVFISSLMQIFLLIAGTMIVLINI